MPSISNDSTAMASDSANKSNVINSMLLRAWRERWDEAQWGTHIKSVLPNDISGDAFDLADNILQQAVVGSDANKLVLSYLRHSLCSRKISHTAVIKRISKFDGFDRPYCLIALLDFVDSIMDGVTCRSKREENNLPNALIELLNWLVQSFVSVLEPQNGTGTNSNTDTISPQHQQILTILKKLLDRILANQFIVANIFIAKQEESDCVKKLDDLMATVKTKLSNKKFGTQMMVTAKEIDGQLTKLIAIRLNGEILERNAVLLPSEQIESITYCLQPYIAINVLLNPNCSSQNYATHLQMLRQIKNYPVARVYSELIRAALICLQNVSSESDISRESMWFAFTFIRVPHIIKQMYLKNEQQQHLDHSPDVVKALDMLIDDPTLDLLDTTCGCNTIEYLLNELAKHNLLNAQQVQQFAGQRDPIMVQLSKIDLNHQPSQIIKHLKKAESPLSGILKALDNDYNKMQESGMLGTLCELLSGNNFELILSVATMEGKLRTFVSRLIRWNESSRQVMGEIDKSAMNRSALFDVTFLMLVFIVQTYGSHVVLDDNGDTFFEKWVRDFMIEKNRNKSAMNMVHQCEQGKVDEFLTSISAADGAVAKPSNLRWHETCLILPGVLYQLLVAWENDTISAGDVKIHLDNIKSRLCAYSVCAASWLCSYMQIVRDDELLKPLNMVQQFITLTVTDDLKSTNSTNTSVAATAPAAPPTTSNNIKERFHLTSQIIRKMQTDAHQNQKVRSPILNIVSNQPLEEQFHEVWRTVSNRGWISIKAAQVLDNLLQSCGLYWLVSKMVNEILYCKYSKDISKSMDIVFAVMHLNIQKCTITLLSDLLPMILLNKTQKFELIEPQLSVLARLCVYCIISSMEKVPAKAKRPPNGSDGNDVGERPAKVRKIDDSLLEMLSDGAEKMDTNSTPNDESGGGSGTAENDNDKTSTAFSSSSSTVKVPEPLKSCLIELFYTLHKLTFSSDLTPKVLFVRQFLIYLHRCGGDSIMPILNLIPSGLMKNLFKMANDTIFNYDFILRSYDLKTENGRHNASANLTLVQSIQHSNNSIKF